MKEIISKEFPIGVDGKGKAGLMIEGGDLVADVQARYPVVKVLEPIKVNFVDKLKALIPGTWDDVLIDKAWAEAVALVSEAPAAPALVAAPVEVAPV